MLSRRSLLAGSVALGLAGRRAGAGDSLHVVLLGDSIFDNRTYVGDAPAVIDRLRESLPGGSKATLLAADGDCVADVEERLKGLPDGATHLVVSVGGNDALGCRGLLFDSSAAVADGFLELAKAREDFLRAYESMLDSLLRRRLPTAVCTVYDPRFDDPREQRMGVAGLALFNDAIVRAAAGRGLPILDLRRVCTSPEDYANPIEPSSTGGARIAREIAALVAAHDFAARRSVLYPAAG